MHPARSRSVLQAAQATHAKVRHDARHPDKRGRAITGQKAQMAAEK